MRIGDVVTYLTETRVEVPALVTCVHSSEDEPLINLVFVSPDETRRDDYGRQLERASSVSPHSKTGLGRSWKPRA